MHSIHHEVHHEHSRTVQGKITEEKNPFFPLSQTPPPLQNMTVDPWGSDIEEGHTLGEKYDVPKDGGE